MTEQTKPTPGKWKVYGRPVGRELWATRIMTPGENGDFIADTYTENYGPSKDESETNARLIAAAPDLLEALKWAIHHAENCMALADRNDPERWKLSEARMAIAKAEGRE